jgi:hypothetical protein
MSQAEAYVQQQQDRAASVSNRAAQMAQAEAYVEQQQDRASENAPILHHSENSRP